MGLGKLVKKAAGVGMKIAKSVAPRGPVDVADKLYGATKAATRKAKKTIRR